MHSSSHEQLGSRRWQRRFEVELLRFDTRANLQRGVFKRGRLRRFMPGNNVRFLTDGREQFRLMLEAIDAARKRIDLEMYIFHPDEAGRTMLEALIRAVRRGVMVRLMYDSVGCTGTPDSFFEPFVKVGGNLIEFNPLSPFRLRVNKLGQYLRWTPNRRDHRKLLVCDGVLPGGQEGAVAFIGGRNIGDEYCTLPVGQGQWRDSGVWLQGPVTVQLGHLFDRMWIHGGGKATVIPTLHCPPVGKQLVMVLDSMPGLANALHWAMRRVAQAARRSVRISCAYFIPNTFWRRALRSIAQRGVLCQVIVPLHSDVPAVEAACRHILGNLIRNGLQIFMYGGGMLHAKELVYDQALSVIGSSNVDQRSFRINYELSVLVLGEDFAQAVLSVHEQDLRQSTPYTLEQWRARHWWQQVVDWWWWQMRNQL